MLYENVYEFTEQTELFEGDLRLLAFSRAAIKAGDYYSSQASIIQHNHLNEGAIHGECSSVRAAFMAGVGEG